MNSAASALPQAASSDSAALRRKARAAPSSHHPHMKNMIAAPTTPPSAIHCRNSLCAQFVNCHLNCGHRFSISFCASM